MTLDQVKAIVRSWDKSDQSKLHLFLHELLEQQQQLQAIKEREELERLSMYEQLCGDEDTPTRSDVSALTATVKALTKALPAPNSLKDRLTWGSQVQQQREEDVANETPQTEAGAAVDVDDADVQACRIALNQAKNVLQQYQQTYISRRTLPEYRPCSSKEARFCCRLRFYRTDTTTPVEVVGLGAHKAEAEKNAALRACAFLYRNEHERFAALRLPPIAFATYNAQPTSAAQLKSRSGLTINNATSYLMHCQQTGAIKQLIRAEPSPVPGGGFVANTMVVVTAGDVHTFDSDGACGRKKEAQNKSDLAAAEWVLSNLHVPIPVSMASFA